MNYHPPDFRDRPKLQRWWVNFLVLIHRRQIKAECCESFRKSAKDKKAKAWIPASAGMTEGGMGRDCFVPRNDETGHGTTVELGVACKGCPTLYDKESASPVYRFLARVGKRKGIPPLQSE